jgi:Fic family protein
MFDPTKPYNKLPLLPPKVNFDDVELLKLVNKANNSLFELKGTANILPNSSILISPLAIREAVASSGIENINTTVAEALKADVLYQKSELTGADKEILHYRDASLLGYEQLTKKGFLNTNSFIEIQSILEPNKKGVRKITGVKIQNSKTGEVVYTPPEGQGVILDKLKNFEEYFNNNKEFDNIDPLIRMAVMHYQFEAIHPFLDGNGRTGRILMILYLVMVGRLDLPILFLSKYILENRDMYYKLLSGVTNKAEWKAWIMYILQAVDKQAQETKVDIIKIKQLMAEYKKIKSNIITPQLIDYLFSNPFYSQKNLAESLSIHRNTTSKYFSELEEAKIVKKFKYKQGNIYYNKKLLDILSY